MPDRRYDIVAIGDFRFPGGAASGPAEQIRAQARAGYKTALVQIKAPVLGYPHPLNPGIRRCLDEGLADLLLPGTPVSAPLVLAYHPQIFTHPPSLPLAVEGETKVFVISHPLVDGAGEPYYDWATIDANAQAALGGNVLWAPLGPLVRAPVPGLANPPPLFHEDWLEIIDVDAWSAKADRPRGGPPVIGRHSRPDPLKWPDDAATTLAAYPDDPEFRVRVLGGGRFLTDLLGSIPANWEVLPFNGIAAPAFLSTIDYFVYHHHSRWVEAFGRVMIEAMASGALAVLPAHFEVLFGEAAVYGPPAAVRDIVRSHHQDPGRYRMRTAAAQQILHDRFSAVAHVRRLERLIGRPRPKSVVAGAPAEAAAPQRAATAQAPRRVLFVTSNGVGMGHLTRLLAIANRCGPEITPVFATMSQAMRVVEDQGYLAEFIPFHGYLGCDLVQWNHYLRHEIDEMISFYGASVLVFDGNVAYGGIVGALRDNPACLGVWCRRAMWRPGGASEESIQRESAFHAVIEPGELAGAYDTGLTTVYRGRTRTVQPVRLLDAKDFLERTKAREELGLRQDGLAVLVQLGSGNNYDYSEVRRLALAHLAGKAGVQVVVAEWLMAEAPAPLPDGVVRLSSFPNARCFNAFDAAVSAAGYNSFHELIAAGVPTVFVPNENPMMDQQVVRAQFAEREGLGLCVRVNDPYRLRPSLDRLLEAPFRDRMRATCLAQPRTNGAEEAATFIGELVHTVRADHNPRYFWTTD